jgi:hypothetical protein
LDEDPRKSVFQELEVSLGKDGKFATDDKE